MNNDLEKIILNWSQKYRKIHIKLCILYFLKKVLNIDKVMIIEALSVMIEFIA